MADRIQQRIVGGKPRCVEGRIGIAPLPSEMVPADLAIVERPGLPTLPEIETARLAAAELSTAACLLRDSIREVQL